ncbi:MAG TPA: hypothetical protein VI197_29525 [Polyangiaceae bacterium]
MQRRTSFHQIATTLATLGTASLVAGDLAAVPASDPVIAREVPHARAVGADASADGDKEKEKDKDKDRGHDEGDDAEAGDGKKKKKGKKEGSCGGHGGCGAGKCG